MARVNVDRELEDEGFHPCLNCDGDEWGFDWERCVYNCLSCGRDLESPPVKKEKVRLVNKTPFKDDWE